MKYLSLFFVLCLFSRYTLCEDSILLSLYFESLCPDSKAFIKTQLYPAKQDLGDALVIDLVPYGFATSDQAANGSWSFTCQHGPDECYGNKVEACALNLYPAEEVFEFVSCAEASNDTASDSELSRCAESVDFTWDRLKQCAESELGDELLVQMGLRTEALSPTFVPTITFNHQNGDGHSQTLQDAALTNLKGLVCELLASNLTACQ